MQSTLTPREIQARLRGGQSVADVAAAAGVDEDYVDNFAGPILAERENAAQLARGAQVRRRGEASSNRKLADAVLDKLAGLGIDEDAVGWDAWREPEENWTVAVSWPAASDEPAQEIGAQPDQERHTALFEFDQRGRFSVAKDALARILIDDQHAAKVERVDPDAEPTIDLNDELAIVRAVQDDEPQRPAVVPDATGPYNRLPNDEPIGHIVNAASVEHTDWSEPDLEQVDGIYQIAKGGDMDVLYEMLAGFNEDSVRIYTGLTKPPTEPQRTATVTTEAIVRTTVQAPAEPERDYWETEPDQSAELTDDAQKLKPTTEQPASDAAEAPEASSAPDADDAQAPAQPVDSQQDTDRGVHAEPVLSESAANEPATYDDEPTAVLDASAASDIPADDQPATPPAPHVPAPEDVGVDEPTQDSLLDDEPPTKPKPKPKARKRASVPSWDEIMFGSPQQRE